MNYQTFYKQLFKPIAKRIGPIDKATIMAIIGFDCGGPVSLCTVGREHARFVTYVTCELAVNDDQKPAVFGRYEMMISCNDERWARDILTRLGRMSFAGVFGHGHTIDIGPVVRRNFPVQGLVVEEFARVTVSRKPYGLLYFHGVTRSELDFAMEFGTDALLQCLRRADVYPHTSIKRRKSVDPSAPQKPIGLASED